MLCYFMSIVTINPHLYQQMNHMHLNHCIHMKPPAVPRGWLAVLARRPSHPLIKGWLDSLLRRAQFLRIFQI